nr:LOG family protein [Bacteroidaceae bacterium]
VKEALEIVGKAPSFKDELWMSTSFECKSCFPRLGEYESLAIPTWFYGHEPPTAFATHIAKFFDNSIREDTILTEAYGGLIYMPGSAGTLQEIFQEAVQDHYVCFGYPSPMVFVGEDYWNKEVPVIPFVDYMIKSGHYKNLLINVVDSADDIVKSIVDFKKIYDSKYKK